MALPRQHTPPHLTALRLSLSKPGATPFDRLRVSAKGAPPPHRVILNLFQDNRLEPPPRQTSLPPAFHTGAEGVHRTNKFSMTKEGEAGARPKKMAEPSPAPPSFELVSQRECAGGKGGGKCTWLCARPSGSQRSGCPFPAFVMEAAHD